MVSRVPGNSEPIDVNAIGDLSLIQNQGSSTYIPMVSIPEEGVSKSGQALKHSAGLIAGIVVLGVALAIVAVALTILAPGAPQAIVLAIAFAGISVGGVTTLRSLINGIKDLVAPRMSVKQRAKSAALLGAGLAGAGLVLKFGSSYIPGGYGSTIGKFGDISYSRGSGALFAGFAHYLYVRFFQSKKAASGVDLTPEEMLVEGAKIRKIARCLVLLGAGFACLGISLAVVGTLVATGGAAAALIVFAPPLISLGISLVISNMLHTTLGQWRVFARAQQEQDLLAETKLKNIAQADFSRKVEGKVEVDISESAFTSASVERLSDKEINQALSLTKKQKRILALSGLLLVAGITCTVLAGFGGFPVVQVLLLSSIGGAISSSAVPMVASGVIHAVHQLRARLQISLARRREARLKARMMNEMFEQEGRTILLSKEEKDETWERAGRSVIVQTEKAIREHVNQANKEEKFQSIIVATMILLSGLAILALTLVPGLAPIAGGVLAIGGVLLGISITMYLQKLIHWLHQQLVKLYNHVQHRQSIIVQGSEECDFDAEDIIVDLVADSFEIDGDAFLEA
ncbi:hypothetical protein FTM89_03420 [Chlamydia trachomatis]|uniref:Membrane protein n=2 Tax=Chlamydia muridarum TaxID=83560 RepID=A0A069ZQ19_CHLMR|nr:hypothetical protein [Chlamydia muridarum]UFT44032.1 hypothetical protein FTN72_03435 [Chlamydia trachomatis]AAF39472.1 conserved hypothetical protein [Chlamydia muridarum str. Nigg]AHH23030.1 membrane protein [Chlamydia muridarum str. Nigg3 CMUT3-5]AHH23955.1 membrane protein [Chlamydia muridarum str. Nigg CM972]AID38162.1 membrane protein [Chlamydia muridarum str. Nigg 2 MCR]